MGLMLGEAAVASGVRGVADEFHAFESVEFGWGEDEGVGGGREGGLEGGPRMSMCFWGCD